MKKITLKQLEELRKLPDIIMYYRINDNEKLEKVEILALYEIEEFFDQMIEESHEKVKIAGNYYNTSLALKKIDRISYGERLNDYAYWKGWQLV